MLSNWTLDSCFSIFSISWLLKREVPRISNVRNFTTELQFHCEFTNKWRYFDYESSRMDEDILFMILHTFWIDCWKFCLVYTIHSCLLKRILNRHDKPGPSEFWLNALTNWATGALALIEAENSIYGHSSILRSLVGIDSAESTEVLSAATIKLCIISNYFLYATTNPKYINLRFYLWNKSLLTCQP